MIPVRMFDDAAPLMAVTDVRTAAVQGAGPGHLQDIHARTMRTRMAPQEPEAIQRVPTAVLTSPSENPQQIPAVAQLDHIDAGVVAGVEGAARPGQNPYAGWDGELDAFAPDWAHPTIW